MTIKPLLASTLFGLALALTLPACAVEGSQGMGEPDQTPGESSNPPSGEGTVVGECGEIPDGQAACTGTRLLEVCEGESLVEYECIEGSYCAEDGDSADGVNCFCDDVADGLCPDVACTADPDCAEEEAPPVELSVHGFVSVDGQQLNFDDLIAYEGGNGDRTTISADVGPDCPLGANCTTLYVSFPVGASPGYKSCDSAGVSMQFSIGSARYFDFGSGAVFCGFRLDVNDDNHVAVSDISAMLEQENSAGLGKSLNNGELVSEHN